MKYFYEEYLYVPKHGRIRDKVMTTRLVLMVTIIVFCLIAMSLSAYAYFTSNVASEKNRIKTATFETRAFVFEATDEKKNVEVKTNDDKTLSVSLTADTMYIFTLEPTENSTAATGFVTLTATGCEDTFHTQQLGVDESVDGGKTRSITFQLSATKNTTLTMKSQWGTHSYYDDYTQSGTGHRLYVTGERTGQNAVELVITKKVENAVALDEDGDTTSSEESSD